MEDYYFNIPTDKSLFPTLLSVFHKCENEVTFESDEGDCISLRSTLGQFIFFTLISNQDVPEVSMRIRCRGKHDCDLLKKHLAPL